MTTIRPILLTLGLVAAGSILAHAQADCQRGKPEPFFLKQAKRFKTHTFKRINSHEAIEKIQMDSGARIKVKHWGCEYYAITITITPPSQLSLMPNVQDSIVKASNWLQELRSFKISLVFDLDLAATALYEATQINPNLAYGDEIPVPGDGTDSLQTRVTVDKPPTDSPNTLIITLLKGPL